MATAAKDKLTAAIPVVEAEQEQEPRVSIILPLPPEADNGLAVDMYEHVTVNGETTLIKRGEYVNVTVPVFVQLRNRYPFI